MRMTFWRWTLGLVVGCGALALLLLPFPPTIPQAWASAAPPQLAAEIRRLTQSAVDAQTAVRQYRTIRALDRWIAESHDAETTLVRLDRSVPTSIAAQVRRIAVGQWASLGTTVSGRGAEVFIYVDSTSLPRSDNSPSRRVLETRKLVDVTFALPPATDGRRCVAFVRLRGSSAAHVSALQGQSLIGVCGFYAAFGLPGAGVQAWLTRTNYRFAQRSDWSVARAPATDASSLYTLSEPAGRCLTGNAGACGDVLRLTESAASRTPSSTSRVSWVLDTSAPAASGPAARLLGDAEAEFLADAVRAIGPRQFGRFWQAESAPDTAFQMASGLSLHAWTPQWLVRTYGEVLERPSARPRDLVWLSVISPIALVIAARPRQRVLSDLRSRIT